MIQSSAEWHVIKADFVEDPHLLQGRKIHESKLHPVPFVVAPQPVRIAGTSSLPANSGRSSETRVASALEGR